MRNTNFFRSSIGPGTNTNTTRVTMVADPVKENENVQNRFPFAETFLLYEVKSGYIEVPDKQR